ncbi:MAG: transcription elongation factor GreB [Alphaproteobacteria bacterium]|nr:transcription elongation factor GreB [Alphaproteobacteria bacterium]
MNRAFTKEGDEAPPPEIEIEHAADLPAGAKNYISAAGHRRLQDELKQLVKVERPKVVETVAWAAGNGDRSENGDYIYGKKRLREIDGRIRFLTKRLEIAEIVDPAAQPNRDQIFFGATVTYATSDDKEHTVTIVGIDEADADHGKVSWISPVARALLKSRVGDVVELKGPRGVDTLEVVSIAYPDKA